MAEKRNIIIKNPKAKIYPKRDYLVILDDEDIVIGYRYIQDIYIHKDSFLPFKYLLRLLERFRVFYIDGFGNILGEVRNGWFFSGLWY